MTCGIYAALACIRPSAIPMNGRWVAMTFLPECLKAVACGSRARLLRPRAASTLAECGIGVVQSGKVPGLPLAISAMGFIPPSVASWPAITSVQTTLVMAARCVRRSTLACRIRLARRCIFCFGILFTARVALMMPVQFQAEQKGTSCVLPTLLSPTVPSAPLPTLPAVHETTLTVVGCSLVLPVAPVEMVTAAVPYPGVARRPPNPITWRYSRVQPAAFVPASLPFGTMLSWRFGPPASLGGALQGLDAVEPRAGTLSTSPRGLSLPGGVVLGVCGSTLVPSVPIKLRGLRCRTPGLGSACKPRVLSTHRCGRVLCWPPACAAGWTRLLLSPPWSSSPTPTTGRPPRGWVWSAKCTAESAGVPRPSTTRLETTDRTRVRPWRCASSSKGAGLQIVGTSFLANVPAATWIPCTSCACSRSRGAWCISTAGAWIRTACIPTVCLLPFPRGPNWPG